ncbi:MAG: hypothetical protein JJT75_13935 [Opitutales bacterium]|nr:hypothetical protein [Opitutales bacterium]
MKGVRIISLLCTSAWGLGFPVGLSALEFRVLLEGPLEIQADWSASEEAFSVWVDNNEITYPLEEIIFYIGSANLLTMNAAIAGYWGLEEGDEIYEIPDTDNPNNPSDPAEVTGFALSRVQGFNPPGGIEWNLSSDGLERPVDGEILMGDNEVRWDTRDLPGTSSYTEGGSGNELFWAFTEPGLYRVPVHLVATIDDELEEGGPFYLNFYVDPPGVALWQRWAIYSLGAVSPNELAALDPLETFSGSGVTNLLSYAFDIPLGAGTNGSLLSRAIVVENNGEQYLGLSFREPEGNLFTTREDLEWVLEGSTDLESWDDLVEGEEEDFLLLDDGVDGDGVPRKIARLTEPVSETSRRFLRLRFELQTNGE